MKNYDALYAVQGNLLMFYGTTAPHSFQKKPDAFKNYSTFECFCFQDIIEKTETLGISTIFKLMP